MKKIDAVSAVVTGVFSGRRPDMKRVITYGTFDILHPGHIHLLKSAKQMADILIVALAPDNAPLEPGKNQNCFSYQDRKSVLEALKYVDLVIPDNSWDHKIENVKRLGVDLCVMGDNWVGKFDFLNDYCDVMYLPRLEEYSSEKVKQNLLHPTTMSIPEELDEPVVSN